MSNLNEFIDSQQSCYVFIDTYSSYLVFERTEDQAAHVWTWQNTDFGWAEARRKIGWAASTGGGAHISWYEAGHLTALLRIAEARSCGNG